MKNAFWNVVLSGFFVLLVLACLNYLYRAGLYPAGIGLGTFCLMALATFRLVRLFTYDLITKFMRDWFVGAKEGSLSSTLGALLNCPWCTGLWFSAVVAFAYYATPLAWPFILILAIAAAGSFIQILSNLIGWQAESKKRSMLQ